jgi:hypothetical protein
MPRCTALTRRGVPCRAAAQRGSNPPRCRAHRLLPANAPPPAHAEPAWGAAEAEVEPVSLQALIGDLVRRVRALSQYLDAHPETDVRRFAALVKLQGELTSRIARLLRQAQSEAPTNAAIQEALDYIARATGVDV